MKHFSLLIIIQVEDKVAEQNQKNKTEQSTEESSESKGKENEADPVIPNNKMELKYKYREGVWEYIDLLIDLG